jgi:lipoyl(octanoyl) transferase
MISVLQLGTIDYATGLSLQQKLVDLRKANRIADTLLLLEHTPVITLGRNAKTANILASPDLLAQRGVEVCESDRGGDVTFHGPGQLVGYPIFDLRALPSNEENRKTVGAIEYIRRLEEVLIRTCADFAIPTKRIKGLTGVWTEPRSTPNKNLSSRAQRNDSQTNRPAESRDLLSDGANSPEAKIAALGVHISRAVTSHGFALNVNTDLSFFDLIIPCGITSKPVTSMEKELGKAVPLQDVAHSISRNFGAVFNSQMLWLETLDDLLTNTVGVPLRQPTNLRDIHKEEDIYRA